MLNRLASLSLLIASSMVNAQSTWTAVTLDIGLATYPQAVAVTAHQQAGYWFTDNGFDPQAVLWNGGSSPIVSLNPPGAKWSRVNAAFGKYQFGEVEAKATIWEGTAESARTIAPINGYPSVLMDGNDEHQVGSAVYQGRVSAGLWSGTSESFIPLNPARAYSSIATAIDGDFQAGYAYFGDTTQAGIWRGTADSWVSLHPENAKYSFIFAAHSGEQIGFIQFNDYDIRSGLWRGTTESFVQLTPSWADGSHLEDTYGGIQVGLVVSNYVYTAAIWRGTPESAMDLHQFLPSDFERSVAKAVYSDGVKTYVVGKGLSKILGEVPVLWTSSNPVPEPASILVLTLGALAVLRRRRRE